MIDLGQHVIDSDGNPYDPEKLPMKDYVGASAYFDLDLRAGIVKDVLKFPEMRKPSYSHERFSSNGKDANTRYFCCLISKIYEKTRITSNFTKYFPSQNFCNSTFSLKFLVKKI